jgi:HTH-type transcriptional regulator/antitoxin HigA
MKNWKVLKTEAEYQKALARLDEVIDAGMGASEGDELELVALLIKDYEEKHYPVKLLDPINMIKLRMGEMGLKNKDLVDIIGSESHVSSVLGRKRQITLEMARKLSKRLNIRASIFINDNFPFEQYENEPDKVPFNADWSLKGQGKNQIHRLAKEMRSNPGRSNDLSALFEHINTYDKKNNPQHDFIKEKMPAMIYYAHQSSSEYVYILADLITPSLKPSTAKSEHLSDFVVRINGDEVNK